MMSCSLNMPRVVIAATGSGVGKTTATVGLISALRARGLRVAAFKCGPDYLDPSYHRRAAGVNSHNLDGWMMGRNAVLATFARGSRDFDIAVIEGMMGLYDSATPTGDEGSTAEIAKWLNAPVLLVIDASGMARSIAAMAAGYAHFDRALKVAGIICNRIGSRGHLDMLKMASAEVPVVGGLPGMLMRRFRSATSGCAVPMKMLCRSGFSMRGASWPRQWLDLDAIVAIARAAPALEIDDATRSPRNGNRKCRIGIAWDDAFHFYYEDNLRRLEECGAEIVRFSPSRDAALPEVDGLYFGGGYPEVLARELSNNHRMIDAVRRFAESTRPIYAECGGLMYLAEAIRTLDGSVWPMAGLIPGVAVMSPSSRRSATSRSKPAHRRSSVRPVRAFADINFATRFSTTTAPRCCLICTRCAPNGVSSSKRATRARTWLRRMCMRIGPRIRKSPRRWCAPARTFARASFR